MLLRRVALTIVSIVVGAAAVVGLIAFLNSRDDSTTASAPAGPGTTVTAGTAGSGLTRQLALGNVALVYGSKRAPTQLVAIQRDVAGSSDPALAAAGQGVLLVRRPGTSGVVALAFKRELRVPSAKDPRLRTFTDYWLGRGG